MKIVFVLERPSQFDAPLFRLAARDSAHQFEAWFTAPDAAGAAPDPELGREVDWGFDRTAGYASALVPLQGRRSWLARRLASEKVDLLITNGYTRGVYREACRLARAAGVPTALRIDSVRFPGARDSGLLRRLLVGQLLPRRFDHFLTTGTLGGEYLLELGVGASRIGRFPYAVDHQMFATASMISERERAEVRARLGVPTSSRMLLALTKFSEREAPWDLLAARGRLQRSDLVWVLAGEGPLRGAFERERIGRKLDRVVLPGYVPYPELPRMYAAADLFVHPVGEERWGVSVAEALACRLPVVTSDRVGSGYDLIEAGENGERYRSGNGVALAAAIERALALEPERIARASAPRLAAFGLESTWKGLLTVAAGA